MSGFDKLPYHDRLDTLRTFLQRHGSLAALLLDLSELSQVEHDYGSHAYNKVLATAIDTIVGMKGSVVRDEEIMATTGKGGDGFLIFLAPNRDGAPVRVTELDGLAARIEGEANYRLGQMVSPYLRRRPSTTVGYSVALDNPLLMPERLIRNLIKEAWESVRFHQAGRQIEARFELQDILIMSSLRTVFQPILELSSGTVHGYEALTRGPANSSHESPARLFETASKCDMNFELDRLCRRTAFRNAKKLPDGVKLFVNVMPAAVYDVDFQGENLINLLGPLSLTPGQIVLELTEKHAIENYSLFGEAVRNFTQMGFKIAVDDIGAGYSGLDRIARLKPDYMKFDMSLVHQIDNSQVRREMVSALQHFAHKVKSTKIIAEGIERQEELEVLLELEIDYGQGYLLGRPQPAFVS